MSDQEPQSNNKFVSAYNKVWHRLSESLNEAEMKSWDILQQQVEEAVNLELAAEEMTRDELDLIGAYVQRDISQLARYSHSASAGIASFLKFDLNYLESSVLNSLLAVADRTRVDQELLHERLDHEEDQYLVGEIAAAGTLTCLECGSEHRLLQTVVIEPCQQCKGLYFTRQTENSA